MSRGWGRGVGRLCAVCLVLGGDRGCQGTRGRVPSRGRAGAPPSVHQTSQESSTSEPSVPQPPPRPATQRSLKARRTGVGVSVRQRERETGRSQAAPGRLRPQEPLPDAAARARGSSALVEWMWEGRKATGSLGLQGALRRQCRPTGELHAGENVGAPAAARQRQQTHARPRVGPADLGPQGRAGRHGPDPSGPARPAVGCGPGAWLSRSFPRAAPRGTWAESHTLHVGEQRRPEPGGGP